MKKDSTSDPKFSSKTDGQTSSGLKVLFEDGICDIYWAENHLVKSLPKMIAEAGAKELKDAIANHLQETKNQVARLEQVFELLGKKAIAKKCDAMEGLTKEAEGIVESTIAGTDARDLGIILASQKVEHYEIATYTGLHKLSLELGLDDVAQLLAQSLAEEQKADDKLSDVAKKTIYDQHKKKSN